MWGSTSFEPIFLSGTPYEARNKRREEIQWFTRVGWYRPAETAPIVERERAVLEGIEILYRPPISVLFIRLARLVKRISPCR